jgi:hypothetical protein
VRLTVKQAISAETAAALQRDSTALAGKQVQPVPLNNLACSLEIPFRVSGTPTPQTQRFPASITQRGDQITLTIALLDDWVRLSYSALAFATPADMPPARIIVDYAFMCYTPVTHPVPVFGGGILSHLNVVESASELPGKLLAATLVRRDLKIESPGSTIQYRIEDHDTARTLPIGHIAATALMVARPNFISAQPSIPPKFLSRSMVREETVPALLPCSTYGNFYLQQTVGGGWSAIGCQDSLKLGDTTLRVFEEITALRDPAFRVHRSLQQPGRFLLQPAAYRVGRYGIDAGSKAFRPMMVLYGVISNDPSENRYALTATLIPDLSPSMLAKLSEGLVSYTPSGGTPSIVYPTDPFVSAKISFSWAIPDGLDTPQALTILDNVQVTLTLPLAHAALLTAMMDRDGMQGGIAFSLPDGTVINAALIVDTNVVGPPDTGPVTVTVQNGTATLQNRNTQTMSVSDLVSVTPTGNTHTTAVNSTLSPGGSMNVAIDATAAHAFANAKAAAPGTLEELDVFVEDVTTTITFINQVNFANHHLTALSVAARLKANSHIETTDLPEGKTADVSFTLPIDSYLAQQTLEYSLLETGQGSPVSTAWREWDLTNGIVIGITPDQL